jgi:DNA-binding CsgD family transcriptional regulator
VLLERVTELSAIRAAVWSAASGRGGCVAVEGPAGVGKSSLWDAGRAEADSAGLVVLSARGGELERGFPHGVARQLLERSARLDDELLAAAAALAAPALGIARPAGVGVGDSDGEFGVTHGLYWLVCNLADRSPVTLAIDDAHLCDEQSLEFLLYLVRRLEGLPVLVILTSRSRASGHNPRLRELLAAPLVEVLSPALLSQAASAHFVRAELGDDAGPKFVEACHLATGGNPFLLRELLVALRSDGVRSDDQGALQVPRLSPRGVSRSVLMRARGLPVEAITLARAIVTLGEAVEPRHAAALAGLDLDRAFFLCDALVEAGVLARGRPLRFLHPVIGEAVRDDMPAGGRAGLHARAARLLAEDGESADRVATHLQLTDPRADPWVVETLRQAASIARARGAPGAAQRWLARALAEGVNNGRSALLRELGEAEWLAGESASATEHLLEAISRASDADDAGDAALMLARAFASTGDVERATTVLNDAARSLSTADASTAMRIEAERATFALVTGAGVEQSRERLERLAIVSGDHVGRLLVLCALAAMHMHAGGAAAALAFARRGLADDRLLAAGAGDSFPYLGAVTALSVGDAHDEAESVLDLGMAHAIAQGSSTAFAYASAGKALLAWLAGDVARCEAMARAALEPEIPIGYVQPTIHAYLVLALTERGKLEEAEAAVVWPTASQGPSLRAQGSHTAYALARLRRAQGRTPDALAALRAHGTAVREWSNQLPYPPWRLDAAECLLCLDEREQAIELIDEHAVHAQRWGTSSALGATLRVRGLAARDRQERIRLLLNAESMLASSPARLEHARTLVDLGAALRAAGQRSDAQDRLRAGSELAGACGATVLQRRAHDELVATGARPRRLRFSGLDALTPSERRVCEMAATGQGNAEIAQSLFITRSTVEKHLAHAYRKLGIHVRSELAIVLENGHPADRRTPARARH